VISKEDEAVLKHGDRLAAIRIIRAETGHVDLRGALNLLEGLRAGRISLAEVFGTKALRKPCPHCRGTGFVD
jgi:hypothetical protein